MVRSEIQGSRMRSYFIESAKNILRTEGMKALSVRTVAEAAGYSYATLYGHFKNLNDLIFNCVNDFLQECKEFIMNQELPKEHGLERLIALTKSYMKFFVQYTGIFELFYLEKLSSFASSDDISIALHNFLNELLNEDWDILSSELKLDNNQLTIMKELHTNLVTGIMIFYINRRFPSDYKEFLISYDIQAKSLLH